MCPIWARLSVRILVGFLAVPLKSACSKDALSFCLKGDLCFAWMPLKVGASRLSYQKAYHSLPQLQAGMPPRTWVALSPDSPRKLKRGRPVVTNLQRKFYLTMSFLWNRLALWFSFESPFALWAIVYHFFATLHDFRACAYARAGTRVREAVRTCFLL